MDLSYKKRFRLPASCSVCRKRKSKCDKSRPVCGSCKKKSIAHLCYYENDPDDADFTSSGPAAVTTSFPPYHGPPPGHPQEFPPHIQPIPPPPSALHHHQPPPAGIRQQAPPGGYPPLDYRQHITSLPPPPPPLPHHHHHHHQPPPQHHHHQLPPQLPQVHTARTAPPTVNSVTTATFPPPNAPAHFSSPDSEPSPSTQSPYVHHARAHSLSQNPFQPLPSLRSPSGAPVAQPSPYTQPPPLADPGATAKHDANHSQPSQSSPLPPKHAAGGAAPGAGSPPAVPDPAGLVSVSLGPNATLQVNPSDTMDIFSNASYSLNLEGPSWQQQGTMSYIGLTKCDPFIKILRSYAVLLFKTGEMTNFIRNETIRRKRKSESLSSSSSVAMTVPGSVAGDSASSSNTPTKRGFHENSSKPSPLSAVSDLAPSTNVEVDDEPGDIVEEDGLIVDRIHISSLNNQSDDDDDDDEASAKDKSGAADTAHNSSKKRKLDSDADGVKTEPDGGASEHRKPRPKHSDLLDLSHLIAEANSLAVDKNNRKAYYAVVEKVILQVLPSKMNIFKLFCRFFKYVHPFIAVIEENSFQMDLQILFPSFPILNSDYYSEMKLENENSLNILGILLLILRLGYLSLIHNDPVNNEYSFDEKSIVKDMKKINSVTFVGVLKLCISDQPLASKSSFKLVQCLTILHFYRQVVPDDCLGLGGADGNILFGVILTHAMSIGLNRDPTNYVAHEAIHKREPLIRTWRSLWFYLIMIDATSAIHTGLPLKMPNLDSCDVQQPVFVIDATGEMNQLIHTLTEVNRIYTNISKIITNVQVQPKIIDLLAETNSLEKIFFDFFGKDFFKDCICKPAKHEPHSGFPMSSHERQQSYLKVIKFCIFIQLRTNLSCLYYMISINYENKYSTSGSSFMKTGIELFKIFSKSVIQLVYIMSYVLDNSVELFGRNYDYILTAYNEKCMIKTHSFLTSLFVRLLHHKKDCTLNVHKNPTYAKRLEVMDSLFTIVLLEAELFVGNFRKLSQTYINSYKLYVMSYFVLRQCMENPAVFFEKSLTDERYDHQGTNLMEFFNLNELQYLCKLCEEFRAAKDEQQRLKAAKKRAEHSDRKVVNEPLTKSSVPYNNIPFPASYTSIPSISFLTTSPSNNHTGPDSSESTPNNYTSQPASGQRQTEAGVPPVFSSKESPLGSLGEANAAERESPVYSNLNNFNYGIFENPEGGSEDLLKLFEVYVDFDKSDI